MSYLIALDISTRSLHGVTIPLDPETPGDPGYFELVIPRFKPGTATPQLKSIERCRAIREHAVFWPVSWVDVDVCVVEEPFGSFKGNELREVYGACIASVPHGIEVRAMTAQQWRRKLWEAVGIRADVSKAGGRVALDMLDGDGYDVPADEHWCDALGLGLAARMQWWADQAGMA